MLLVKSYGLKNQRSKISYPDLLIHLLATYAVCCDKINNGSTFLSLAEKTFEIILWSTFNNDVYVSSF